jgi:hypothetical protein
MTQVLMPQPVQYTGRVDVVLEATARHRPDGASVSGYGRCSETTRPTATAIVVSGVCHDTTELIDFGVPHPAESGAPNLLSSGCKSEKAESEVGDQSVFARVVEVEVEELFDSAQPLVEGRAVDDQAFCCRLDIAGKIEEFLGGRASSTCRCTVCTCRSIALSWLSVCGIVTTVP